MKKYILAILSFIISCILFFILISIQKQVIDKDNLISIYVSNKDITKYSNIIQEDLIVCYSTKDNAEKCNLLTDIKEIENMVTNNQINQGEIISKDMMINKDDINTNIDDNQLEKVCIKLKDTDVLLSQLINENSIINVYITINSSYRPQDINNYEVANITSDKVNDTTFLYLPKIKPVMWLDETGKKYSGTEKLSSIILEVTKEQAIYINSVKDIADFKITLN